MTQRLPTALLFLLIALFFSWNTAKAQGPAALPDEIQGNWALPDCGIYDEALVFSRYFYLRSTRDSQTLLVAGLEREAGDYAILSLKDQVAPVQVENDGILTLGVLTHPPARRVRNWPKNWNKLPIDQTIEYTACTEPPSIVPGSLQRLMRYIDRVRDECTVGVTNDCARVAFKFADEDMNQRLTRAEIKSALVSMMLFSELAARGTLSLPEGRQAIDRAKAEGDALADRLFAHYDSDKSKSLDYNELMADVPPPEMPLLRGMLEKAGALLPAFKVAAMALPTAPAAGPEPVAQTESPAAAPEPEPAKPKSIKNFFKRDY